MSLLLRTFKIPFISFLVLILLGFISQNIFNDYIQLIIVYLCINIILGVSLNLVNGYTGQFSLGHAGFMAMGAYTSAFVSSKFGFFQDAGQVFSMLLFAVVGGLAAALAGAVVGLPSLRLKGDYLAIVTLGFGEIIRVMILNTPAVGGARGFYGIPGPQDFQIGNFTVNKFLISYTHAIFWVLCAIFIIWRLLHSNQGRAFLSVREDEVAAESMGVNTTSAKVKSFLISSFFAGVAGSIFAHYAMYLSPATFNFNKSVDAIIMVVLGGMGSLTGTILAAAFITILPEALRPLQDLIGVDLRMVIYSLCLILLMILRPKGLMGTSEWNLHKLFHRFFGKKQESNT